MGDIDRPADPTLHDASAATVRIARRIAEVPDAEWDACARGESGSERPPNPFVSHAFLSALEDSGSATRDTGWLPQHLLFEDAQGRLLACMPCYLKGHSQGEYVFDHGWAEAYMRAGGDYYPKLQAAVPFSPVPGPRLLVRGETARIERQALLLEAGRTLTNELDVSSLHITFMSQDEWKLAGELGYLQRTDRQFHWHNAGYETFDDFLGALASRKRKTIRRERRAALDEDIEIEWITGRDITEAHWDAFFTFYMDTGARKWGRPYLTREAFSRLGESMAGELLLVMAKRGGDYIAGALNVIGADTLYGRYWGALESHDFLHFEVCYYQAIDYAIAHGLARVEAGAQGEHKLARGYLPTETYSAHYIADERLRRAVADFLAQERHAVAEDAALLAAESPYRRKPDESLSR
ncbi:MAG: N-acetyltransferase [Methyloceanibacter sp.]|uniref:GNAT family N-acetyltransferase n=1 Tax=Methyloceanibacter sp. TaxID=1965321 RepID=UPI001E0EBE22|nr:GNAT family N-acetyltransferase [Methyloceanibacter sp.]MCB1442805.1 N-acetyltransferase [Methyloceanibacter sp.]